MNRRLVLDASAAIHIVCGLPTALPLIEILDQTAMVLAPSLFSCEVGNALWEYVRHESMPQGKALTHLREARSLVDRLVPVDEIADEALVAATTYGHPVYDMLYAVPARRTGAAVLTMDRRLLSVLERMEVEGRTV